MSTIESPQSSHTRVHREESPGSQSTTHAPHDSHDDLPKNLKKPHAIGVIAVGLLFLGLLAALFILGYLPHQRAAQLARADAELASADTNLVAVAHPIFAGAAREILLPCDIRPNQDTLIFPRASGYLKHLNVDIHDRVTKDQVLAEIDTPEIDAQILQAEAALEQSKADVLKAQTDLELMERTYARFESAVAARTKQELDERASARDQAKAVVAQVKAQAMGAEANIQRLKTMKSFDIVTAPFSGVITARNYDVGALLSPGGGRELFRLEQSDTVRVFVNMPQQYATEIHTGQTAELTVRNFPNRIFKGTVSRTADAINSATRTMPFELLFPNSDNALVPGMYGQARLSMASPPQTLLIPVSAMLFNASGTQVACVENGRVHFQAISVGRDLGTDLEVLNGLTIDSQVIVNPGERLIEGGAVRVATALAGPARAGS